MLFPLLPATSKKCKGVSADWMISVSCSFVAESGAKRLKEASYVIESKSEWVALRFSICI
jgi:hypothetical protein